MILRKLSRGRGLGLPVVRLICFRVRDDNGWFWPCAQSRNLWISFFMYNSRVLYVSNCFTRPQGAFPWLWGRGAQSQGKAPWGRGCNCFCPLFLNFYFSCFMAHYIHLGRLSSKCQGRLHYRRSLSRVRPWKSFREDRGLISRTAASNQAFCRRIRKVRKRLRLSANVRRILLLRVS